ncbi:MAG: (d)CMP kinase [Candidatus Hinthialibacter antarcticus]|nr:(d)CMP kinase [Candidatus Hinthialibacter antarcticus]
MSARKPIVAIDGPVGVGKSSVAALLAKRLGFVYIDTGAMYRAVTLKALRQNINLENQEAVAALAQTIELRFVREQSDLRILCDGEDVSEAIRAPEVSRGTSPVADNVKVRECLVAMQQALGREGGVVMEGRDIGTVVFPDAEIKIYLNADPKVRADRRYRQLVEKGKPADFESTYQDLIERDRRDAMRPVGALKMADGAIEFDSSKLNQEQVIEQLYNVVISHPSASSHFC